MSAPKKAKAEAPAKVGKESQGAEKAAPTGGGLKSKLMVGIFVSGIVIAETVVFFLMVPSGEEVAALAESRLIAIAQEMDAKKTQEHAHDDSDTIVEFPFGDPLSVSFVPAGADHPYRVEFELFGTIRKADHEHLIALYSERERRFRARMLLVGFSNGTKQFKLYAVGVISSRRDK